MSRVPYSIIGLALIITLLVLTPNGAGAWTLDDFPPGAEKLVRYGGTATEKDVLAASHLTEYFSGEEDREYKQRYSFKAVRVFYPNFSQLYLTFLEGEVSLEYHKTEQELASGREKSESISDSDRNSKVLDKPLKMGTIKADGEVEFAIMPKFLSWSNSCTLTTKLRDGTTRTKKDSSCDYQGIDIGGGKDELCQPDTGDDVLSHAGSCKLYLEEDGSLSGTFQDIRHANTDTRNLNRRRTFRWSLTPIDPI